MIEVEVKLPIYKRSLTEKELIQQGFVPGILVRESDYYYTASHHDVMKRDEALRIRIQENMTELKQDTYLTFKGPKLDQVSMTRNEIELSIDNADKGSALLSALGYHALAPVEKLRQYYKKGDITACVDQVTGLGAFLELEIMIDKEEERSAALGRIESVLHALDSTMQETTTKSYLCMLLEKQKKQG